MDPHDSPQRRVTLIFLGMGIFYIVAGLLSLCAWYFWGAWQPYLIPIVVLAFLITIPVTHGLWTYTEQRRNP